jgi:hypothetical protein
MVPDPGPACGPGIPRRTDNRKGEMDKMAPAVSCSLHVPINSQAWFVLGTALVEVSKGEQYLILFVYG